MPPLVQLQYSQPNLIHFMKALSRDVTRIERRYWSPWHRDEMLSFTVMSYNILALHCEKNRERFPFSSQRFLDRSYRIPKIKEIITDLGADICCLQEVEGGFFHGGFGGMMGGGGMPGETVEEGVWIKISGGNIRLYGGVDVLDSNGIIEISGGTVIVDTPRLAVYGSPNGIIDANGETVKQRLNIRSALRKLNEFKQETCK